MNIDISKIPFSRLGSYFVMSYFNSELQLRDVHGGDESPSELFRLKFDREVSFDCSETKLIVTEAGNPDAKAEFIFPTERSFQVRTSNLSFIMEADKVRYDSFNEMEEDTYEYISYKKEAKYNLEVLRGKVSIHAPWKTVGNQEVLINVGPNSELYMSNYRVTKQLEEIKQFDEAHFAVENEYQNWLESMPKSSDKYKKSRDLASYLLWTNTVRADGLLTEPITYMSKNWMQNIWSWDNCFNALLMADKHPILAYNQLKVFIDHQDESGAYPDFINDKYISYNCVKPPIHAWTYKKMMEINPYFQNKELLETVYKSFSHNTNFWLDYRMHNELPYYTHGNDSGWDNASIFHEGFPITTPDLSAYLIRQMDILADFASILDLPEEKEIWEKKAESLFSKFLPTFFDGKQLLAHHTFTGKKVKAKTSAILFLPIVISYRLNAEVKNQLISDLLNRFECEYGIATEEPTSHLFTGDGYWLGPVWAPETYIFVDALHDAGYDEVAERISKKFCEATLVGGLAENFNADTGEGNDDLAFSWTSSVFLLLANALVGSEEM